MGGSGNRVDMLGSVRVREEMTCCDCAEFNAMGDEGDDDENEEGGTANVAPNRVARPDERLGCLSLE